MKRLIVESCLLLLYFEYIMRIRGFKYVHGAVRERPVNAEAKPREVAMLSHAVDFACVFYFKRVLCLQRSAATAVLLRRYGWKAEMVIGMQLLPIQSHAWVEVDGHVVNDKPYVNEIFHVLERC